MCIVHRLDAKSPERIACAQAGCETCLEALLKRHERLVHTILPTVARQRSMRRSAAGGTHWSVASDQEV